MRNKITINDHMRPSMFIPPFCTDCISMSKRILLHHMKREKTRFFIKCAASVHEYGLTDARRAKKR